jgi:polyphosphate kinase 2
MKKVLNEIKKIQSLIGVQSNFLINEDEASTETRMKIIKSLLSANNILKNKIEKTLQDIVNLSNEQIINFDLLERGIRKVLKMKGDKEKNIQNYLDKVFTSLKKREPNSYEGDVETEDYGFEIEEPSILSKKIYKKELYYLQVELLKLQEWLNKTGKTVILVFEGRDSAGKGSTIKKFTENLNPRYFNIIALGIPTPEERQDWYGRYSSKIKNGMINFFDRSWYNRGLIEPVMGYGTEEEYNNFMDTVTDFESKLVEKGDYLFKLWFSIDKETQKRRFDIRQKSPLKQWKYSPNDAKMQDLWDRFTEFKERLFDKTSTVNHPWIVLDSNDKRISGLNAIRYVLQNIPYENKNTELLDKEFPEAMYILKPEE